MTFLPRGGGVPLSADPDQACTGEYCAMPVFYCPAPLIEYLPGFTGAVREAYQPVLDLYSFS